MATARVLIGLGALFTPGPFSRLLGYPPEQDSPTARLMGRLFGGRDIALGALVWRVRDEPSLAPFAYGLNAAVDATDAASMAAAIAGRQGIDRAAALSAVPALTAILGWTYLATRGS